MTDQSIFDQQQGTPAPAAQPAAAPQAAPQVQAQVPTYEAQLQMIVNESGEQKYKNVEEALKGSAHAQAHIATLTQKVAELEQEASKATTLDSVMEAMNKSTTPEQSTPPAPAGLDPSQLAEQFKNFYNTAEQEKIAVANEQAFSRDLMSAYGDKAVDTMATKAQELGVDLNVVRDMARKSPLAAKKLLGLENHAASTAPLQSSINTAALDNQTQNKPADRVFSMAQANTKDVMSEWNRVSPDKYNK